MMMLPIALVLVVFAPASALGKLHPDLQALEEELQEMSAERQMNVPADMKPWCDQLKDLSVEPHKKCNEYPYANPKEKSAPFQYTGEGGEKETCTGKAEGNAAKTYCNKQKSPHTVYFDMDGTIEQHDWLAHDLFHMIEGGSWGNEFKLAKANVNILQKSGSEQEANDLAMGLDADNLLTNSLTDDAAANKNCYGEGEKKKCGKGLRPYLDAIFDACYIIPTEEYENLKEGDAIKAEVNKHPEIFKRAPCATQEQKKAAFLHRYFDKDTCGDGSRLASLTNAIKEMKKKHDIKVYTMSAAWDVVSGPVWADYIEYLFDSEKFGLAAFGLQFDDIRTIGAWTGAGNKGLAIARLNGLNAEGTIHIDNSFKYMAQIVKCTAMNGDQSGDACTGNGGGMYVVTHTGVCASDIDLITASIE